jgi:uroporphyrinogen decarboxylase
MNSKERYQRNEAFMAIYQGPELTVSETERTCPLGIRYQRAAYDWKLGADEALTGPLENAGTTQDVLKHPWPKPQHFDVEALIPECEENAERVIVSGFWTAIFGNAYRMHGFENFPMNLALKPELIKTLVDRLTEFNLELNQRLFSALKDRINVFYMGNDFGSQNGLLFSRDGGYIFAPCNAIQADTPPESVEAMYRTVREYRPGGDLHA